MAIVVYLGWNQEFRWMAWMEVRAHSHLTFGCRGWVDKVVEIKEVAEWGIKFL